VTGKVCLINPPTTDPTVESSIYFPMALVTLGGVLKKLGVGAELWDFDLYFKRVKNATEAGFRKLLRQGIRGMGAEVFGISSICSNFPMALWIAREIKAYRPDSLIILGGPQPSSVPREILENFEFVDVVVAGEGELTLEEMVKAGFDRERLAGIPGVAVRSEGGISFNQKRTLVSDMDVFPLPDYSLINFGDYETHQRTRFRPHIEVGRGCPFTCTFCSTALMWERDFRVKSPRRILDEMESLHRAYQFTEFDFIHDNFTTSKKFISEFCDFMEEHNTKGFRWEASSRTDCIDVPRLERMHSAGLTTLFFGIESGSKRIQKVMKKNLSFENFEPVIQRANELGMNVTTAFILGFTEETEEDVDETVRRALHYRSLGTHRVYFSKLAALTGTGIYRETLPKLKALSRDSNVSPQHYSLPYIREVIEKYPELFSSFYHVPHPRFSAEYLSKFIEFAHLLVNGSPKAALSVIENLDIGATKLFALWDSWANAQNLPYYNFTLYSLCAFRSDFPDFLKERVFHEDAPARAAV
jgi:radical SAM superfamily enzyme YgiQ (UPF0313 family)